ncbi:MAG: DUF58 domain-containing protein [Rhodothermales bacterium]|nr:DUF58 domain-containing protein [Rhodothermales bacterium]
MSTAAPTRFIRPDVLSRIGNLDMLARGVVEGFIAGLHRSPYKGFSSDFMEYRPYIPGDDTMHVDWKAWARTDRLFVKEFEDETNTHMQILVDSSASMGFASHPVSKLQYSLFLAASLAYLMIRQRDAVGFTLFDDDIRKQVPARSTKGHLQSILVEMQSAEPAGETSMTRPLHLLAERYRKRGIIVLISDFFGDLQATLEGLQHFRFKGHDVILFQVLDPAEMSFTFDNFVEFEDLETGRKMLVDADHAREEYLGKLEAFQQKLRQECSRFDIDLTILGSDQPLDFALFNYLAARRRRN